jgi:putative heme-binding domain-containing protein
LKDVSFVLRAHRGPVLSDFVENLPMKAALRRWASIMRVFALPIFTAVVLVSFAPICLHAQRAGQKSASSVDAGRQAFSSICASCHGLDARGGERGPDIATRPEVVRLSDDDLLKVLRTGIPEKGMPAFAALGPAKLSSLLRYLRSLQGKGAEAGATGDATKGEELFSGKGGCSACHMVNGSGGFLGPELSSYGANHNAAEIRGAIVNAKERSGQRHGGAEVTTKDGKSYSGLVRNEDNFSLQLQSTDGAFHFFSKSDVASINYHQEPVMPTDYGARLSAVELDALAAYLLQVAHTGRKPAPAH